MVHVCSTPIRPRDELYLNVIIRKAIHWNTIMQTLWKRILTLKEA